jgi:hypothetical protein
VPTKNKEITPFGDWEKKRLNLAYLRTWGCLEKVNVPINKKQKLEPKTVDCVFLGYAIHSVGYRFLITNSSVSKMAVDTIIESRDATFFEDEFPMKNNTPSISSYDSVSIPESHELIVHADVESHEQIFEEDNNIVTRKSKSKGLQNHLVKTLLYTSWMTLPQPLLRHIPLLTLICGRKLFKVR